MARVPGRMGWFYVLLALLVHTLFPFAIATSPGFLIISAPRLGRISYVPLPDETGSFEGMKPVTLISKGLQHPQGVAMDMKRKKLFVADPDVRKVYAYQFSVVGNTLTTDGVQQVLADGVESRWVSVDTVGNVFFTDEPSNRIMRIPASHVFRGNPVPEVLYDGTSTPQVSGPGGIATDNFHVYWTNKALGSVRGVLVKGAETPETPPTAGIAPLANNIEKSYGVCLGLKSVFYTDASKFLWGVENGMSAPVQISDQLVKPRGCVADKVGTVYVADRAGNAVYAFAGSKLRRNTPLVKAFDYEDAFGLAVVLNTASRLATALSALPVAVVLAFSVAAQGLPAQ